ncbi:Sugar kinase of the NBD/HSP70 family, may contain an N-terminal HTH domain [Amycolatopsis pretoriensis]|uniref:Sugar kinase of the NBD/HSP70 family, may contain an N-terminal HTH domain n=1 Tax=Amycolatopsis pretoriensis TaxID=218821 RepID=A0A1H5R449_9PSEU|nr:ROK family transcriptional regulator [Amycolatopsis pretoriensis]SEF33155.1 Sugar kinase of the NBD/HSP70 family, may contain an N-terminal HTH domain [Amycolatopsis pretoriensis]
MTQAVRHDAMRARNLEVVLGAVGRGGPLTRAALAELTGLTKSTVSKLVGDLVDAGLLAETGPARAGERGRPGVEVVLSGARVASLGLEINVDYLAARVLDLTGGVRFAARRERDNRGSRPKKVLSELQALATEALAEAHRLGLEVAGAVLAVSGPVGDGVLFSAPNLGWQDVRPAGLLRLPVPVELDNEANLAALGELWYGDGERDFLYVSGEVGIGAGLVVNGTLFSGARGLAGELGHVVVAPEGPLCRCGGSGCLETFAGQEALLAAGKAASVPALLAALEAGDATARQACAAAGRALGIALTSAVNLLDLDRIVLGGVFTQLYPWLSGPVSEVLTARLGGLRGEPPVLTASRLGGDAATLGAAGRVVHRVLADPARFVSRAQEA